MPLLNLDSPYTDFVCYRRRFCSRSGHWRPHGARGICRRRRTKGRLSHHVRVSRQPSTKCRSKCTSDRNSQILDWRTRCTDLESQPRSSKSISQWHLLVKQAQLRFYWLIVFTVEDFSPIPEILRHTFVDNLRCDPMDHPVLLTEGAWNTPANRERMAEILFEEFKVPAFYTANSGVLTALVVCSEHTVQLLTPNRFGAGKGTALVVDVGSHFVNVVPVVDGFVLRKGTATSKLWHSVLTTVQVYRGRTSLCLPA